MKCCFYSGVVELALSEKMKQAIELLNKEEFYLCKNKCSVWKAYNLSQTIHTKTMEALVRRGAVTVQLSLTGNVNKMAKIINPDYEELTASEYCLRCIDCRKSSMGRYRCDRTGKLVIGTDGRATVNAMKCR